MNVTCKNLLPEDGQLVSVTRPTLIELYFKENINLAGTMGTGQGQGI